MSWDRSVARRKSSRAIFRKQFPDCYANRISSRLLRKCFLEFPDFRQLQKYEKTSFSLVKRTTFPDCYANRTSSRLLRKCFLELEENDWPRNMQNSRLVRRFAATLQSHLTVQIGIYFWYKFIYFRNGNIYFWYWSIYFWYCPHPWHGS